VKAIILSTIFYFTKVLVYNRSNIEIAFSGRYLGSNLKLNFIYSVLKTGTTWGENIRKMLHITIYLQSCPNAGSLQWINSWSLFFSNKYVRHHIIRQENKVTAQSELL
jgi:hypothetical protein